MDSLWAKLTLPVPPLDPGLGTANPMVWCLTSLATFYAGADEFPTPAPLPAPALLDGLTGGCFTLATCPSTCGFWWLGAGKLRAPATLSTILGWRITVVEGDGTLPAYHQELKALVAGELTYGRPLLGYGGWPGASQYHWGIVTGIGPEHLLAGMAPTTGPEPVLMDTWPYRIAEVRPGIAAPLPLAEACALAVAQAQEVWTDPVGRSMADLPPESQWHTGSAAYEVIAQRLERPGPFCEECRADECLTALLKARALDCTTACVFCREAGLPEASAGYAALAERISQAVLPTNHTEREALAREVRAWGQLEAPLLGARVTAPIC